MNKIKVHTITFHTSGIVCRTVGPAFFRPSYNTLFYPSIGTSPALTHFHYFHLEPFTGLVHLRKQPKSYRIYKPVTKLKS